MGIVAAGLGRAQRTASPDERERARRIMLSHGGTGTAFMTLWPGNALFFAPGDDAYVAYRVHAQVAVVLGDPVGPAAAAAGAVAAFDALSAAMAVLRAHLPELDAAGVARLLGGSLADRLPLLRTARRNGVPCGASGRSKTRSRLHTIPQEPGVRAGQTRRQ